MSQRNSYLSRLGVAVPAAIIGGLATYGAMTFVPSTQAQTQNAQTQRREVLKQTLADIPGREVRVLHVDLAPSDGNVPHRHPGHHVFGYILEGAYGWKVDDGPTKVFKPGEIFYEAPGVLHAVSKNASATERAKFLVFMVADAKNPSTVIEPDKK
jgi:quercetin dioxygenase-like cupin family protein